MLRPPAFIRPHGKLLPASGFISPDGYASRKGLWLPWALASSRVRVDFSAIPCLHRWSHGAAGSSPASSHLRPWGPPDRRTGDATRTATPKRMYYTKNSVICFCFCLLAPRRRPRKPIGADLSGEAVREGRRWWVYRKQNYRIVTFRISTWNVEQNCAPHRASARVDFVLKQNCVRLMPRCM